MRAQPPLYCLQVEGDSVPIAVQGMADRSSEAFRSLESTFESIAGGTSREREGERGRESSKRLAAVVSQQGREATRREANAAAGTLTSLACSLPSFERWTRHRISCWSYLGSSFFFGGEGRSLKFVPFPFPSAAKTKNQKPKTETKKRSQSAWSASPAGSGTTSTTRTGPSSSRTGTGSGASGPSWRWLEGTIREKAVASSRCALFVLFFSKTLSVSLLARSQPPKPSPPPSLQPQVGCGVGNAALPLLEVLAPPAPVYACDFSETAIGILRRAPAALRSGGRLRAFVADAARPGALLQGSQMHAFPSIERHSLAAATLIFALSAMSPAAMVAAVENVKGVLSKHGGRAFVRDYAVGDMASARLAGRSTPRRLHAWLPASSAANDGGGKTKNKKEPRDAGAGDGDAHARAEAAAALLSGGEFFARGDGTRAFYFSEGGLRRLFESAGFVTESLGTGES